MLNLEESDCGISPRNKLEEYATGFTNAILKSLLVDCHFNTLKPRQYGRQFPDDIFKCIFLNENVRIAIDIS